MFYVTNGDKLDDYKNLKISAQHEYESILICGECDFSFSKSVITQRNNNGNNMCVTTWY